MLSFCRIAAFILMIVFLSLWLHRAAIASTVLDMKIDALSQEAFWIGRIYVEAIEPEEESKGFPKERVVGLVQDIFKGQGKLGERIFLRIPGGQKGQKRLAVLGFPIFRVGGEYIVFLSGDPHRRTKERSPIEMSDLVGWIAYRVVDGWVFRVGDHCLSHLEHQGYSVSPTRERPERLDDFIVKLLRAMP